VRHLNERAENLLGFRPAKSFRQSMEDFQMWYSKMHGMETPFWPIARNLYIS